MTNREVIAALKKMGDSYLRSDLFGYRGGFPNNFHGDMARGYYEWAKKTAALIRELKDE